ncbi:MAG TPA: hypothetical protein VKU60_18335 [Chloroflexota bacterium]|nr:hypothetical protein [Chloroflexota bacterium]
MVSNVLGLEPEELIRQLQQLRASHAEDPAYQALRAELPEDWPI